MSTRWPQRPDTSIPTAPLRFTPQGRRSFCQRTFGAASMNRSFWRAGHTPTLFASFLYFDLSFMVWYLLGPLQVPIAQALGLDAQQRAFMVAVPILCGAVLRLFLGMLADRMGAKRTGVLAQVAVIATLFVAWWVGVDS